MACTISGTEAHNHDANHGNNDLPESGRPVWQDAVTYHPEIDWVPSFQAYLDRTERRMKAGDLQTELPENFPRAVRHQMSWSGTDEIPPDFLWQLKADEIVEIEAALRHFKDGGWSMDEISPSTFPLPNLKRRLQEATKDVHDGQGCVIFRGLDPDKYCLKDNIILYAGIASYIGAKRGLQDEDGNVIIHVKDVGSDIAPDGKRQSPYTNNAQPFHNDTCDVLCMYAMDRAASGGRSLLASIARIYNEIAADRPDLIHVFSEPTWPFDSHTTPPSHYRRPILFYDRETERVSSCFSRRPLTGSQSAPRLEHLPPLTDAQAEALDAVHFTALKHSVPLQLEKGDMQFFNNLGLLHAREAFSDGEGGRRHMIRLWVRNEELAWQTPHWLEDRWEAHYGRTFLPVWKVRHDTAHVLKKRDSCIG